MSWADLERGKDLRAAMGLPLVLSPVLLGTLLGDTFKFRLECLWSCETAAFGHITLWPKPSSSPGSMGKQQRLLTLIFQAFWGGVSPQLGPFYCSLLLFLVAGSPSQGRSFLQPFQQVFVEVLALPVCWGQCLCSGPQHGALAAHWHFVSKSMLK